MGRHFSPIFIEAADEIDALRADLRAAIEASGVTKACERCEGRGWLDYQPRQYSTANNTHVCPACKGSGRVPVTTALEAVEGLLLDKQRLDVAECATAAGYSFAWSARWKDWQYHTGGRPMAPRQPFKTLRALLDMLRAARQSEEGKT